MRNNPRSKTQKNERCNLNRPTPQLKIAFFIPHIGRGGVARVFLSLAEEFARNGHQVELLVTELSIEESKNIHGGIKPVMLKMDSSLRNRITLLTRYYQYISSLLLPFILPIKISKSQLCLNDIIRYLNIERPDVLFSAKPHTNITAILASLCSIASTKIIITEHTALSRDIATRRSKARWKYILPALKKFYPLANHVITVSRCVENDLTQLISPTKINSKTIYNPIPVTSIQHKMLEPVDHPWLSDKKVPILIAVGRLEEQKDYSTLIQAFNLARQQRVIKLIILGEGKLRTFLNKLIYDLNLENDIDMLGHVPNPYAYMYRSDIFILSSLWEGLPTVLIEAMACGCHIISTDCECGPREILNNGEYGLLVPPDNSFQLAQAISTIVNRLTDNNKQQHNISQFEADTIRKHYEDICLDP